MNEEECYRRHLESELAWVETERQSLRDCQLDLKKSLRPQNVPLGMTYEQTIETIMTTSERIKNLMVIEDNLKSDLADLNNDSVNDQDYLN
jgi:hypothetical protein